MEIQCTCHCIYGNTMYRLLPLWNWNVQVITLWKYNVNVITYMEIQCTGTKLDRWHVTGGEHCVKISGT